MRLYRWTCPECRGRLELSTSRRYWPWNTLKCFCGYDGDVFSFWSGAPAFAACIMGIAAGEAFGIATAIYDLFN